MLFMQEDAGMLAESQVIPEAAFVYVMVWLIGEPSSPSDT